MGYFVNYILMRLGLKSGSRLDNLDFLEEVSEVIAGDIIGNKYGAICLRSKHFCTNYVKTQVLGHLMKEDYRGMEIFISSRDCIGEGNVGIPIYDLDRFNFEGVF